MKRFISVVCCIMFIGVASMSFAADEQNSEERTKVAVEIIQLQSQLQLLNNLVTNLAMSAKNIEDKIVVLRESLEQLNIQPLEERGLDK